MSRYSKTIWRVSLLTVALTIGSLGFAEVPVSEATPISAAGTPDTTIEETDLSASKPIEVEQTALLLSKLSQLQQQVQQLRGQLEIQAHQLRQLALRERRLQPSLAKTNLKPATLPKTERGLYEQGYQFIQSRQFDQALVTMQTLLRRFPTGPYAPNAHYWLGELYYAKGQTQAAIQSFAVVIQNYPNSPKVAPALLKQAFAYAIDGNTPKAKTLLTQVQHDYPDSTAARLATEKLKTL